MGALGPESGDYGQTARLQRAQICPRRRALTVGHQAVVLILVQLDKGGVPAAVRGSQTAGSLCLPGGGQQCEEALIFGGREGAPGRGGRNRILAAAAAAAAGGS